MTAPDINTTSIDQPERARFAILPTRDEAPVRKGLPSNEIPHPGSATPELRRSNIPALQLSDAASVHQSSNPPIHSAWPRTSRPKARNGKIARLPYLIRDMVNRMLRNNIDQSAIKNALEEKGFRVTERNISNWKTRGGYKEWCEAQDRAISNRLFQDNLRENLCRRDAGDLPEVGLQLAATHLSSFFLNPDVQQELETSPQKYSRAIADLCRIARQLHRFQQYRNDSAKELGKQFNPERIKREDEKHVEITRSVYSAEKLGMSPREPDTPHRNYLPRSWEDVPLDPLD